MNIYIGEPVVVSDMQWPCPDGFRLPLNNDFVWLKSIMDWLWLTTANDYVTKLHMPIAWRLNATSPTSLINQWSNVWYWTCQLYYHTVSVVSPQWRYYALRLDATTVYVDYSWGMQSIYGCSIRPFKNEFVIPDSSWTVVQWTLWWAWIFWNQTDGLISITSNWTTWYTIADKNLWATTVYNNGDTMSEANCWKFYQWWNNYWFPYDGTNITTSTSTVNASTYWPWNYYSSSTFIAAGSPYVWDSSINENLRWWVSQWSWTKSVEVKNIYIGEYKPIYKWEYIEYKMNADSRGRLYVPVWWYWTWWYANCSYSWNVSVDWGAGTTYSWTWSSGWSITLSWYTAGSSHIIKITPTTESYLWARAYWWQSTAWATYLTEIVYDASYMWYAVSATDTGYGFRETIYTWCSNLTNSADEYLPDTVTTIGKDFRYLEYNSCSSLTYASEESLPDSVTSIWTWFRSNQYSVCPALTEIRWWKNLSIWNSYYRNQQFHKCTSNKTVKVISDVWYNSDDQNTLQNDYVTSVYVPSAYLTNFKNASNNPWVWITDSKFIWY